MSGQASLTADANGNGTITHAYGKTPVAAFVGVLGDDTTAGVAVQAMDETTVTVRFYSLSTGADVTSGTRTVMWTIHPPKE